ncbi:MAG: nucleotide exchange factor GrpE [Rubripirellula sp.]
MSDEMNREDGQSNDLSPEDQLDANREEAVDEVFESRDEEMDRLRATAEEADKRVLMAQAEAENFRKRMRRDYEDQIKFASVPLVADVLEVRDNLLRALVAAENSADSAGLKEGVAMVAKQLDDTLAKYAILQIPAEGELFDPNFHEAISQMPSDQPAGMVAHVAQSGFQMHDRVVRPSQVVVSTGPATE